MVKSSKDNLLAYRVSGDGYPVVFLHGFLESKSMWKAFCEQNEYRSVLIDLPGHGESEAHLDATRSMQEMALEVRKVIESLGLERYAVVGHSMGGYVALELIKLDPKCTRILLLNSNFWSDSIEKKRDRQRVADIVKTNKALFLYEAIPNLFCDPVSHDSDVKELIQEALQMSSEAIASCSIAMSIRENNTGWIQKNEALVTLVQGAEDRVVTEDQMREELGEVGCMYISIKNVGHMAHLEATENVRGILCDFVLK